MDPRSDQMEAHRAFTPVSRQIGQLQIQSAIAHRRLMRICECQHILQRPPKVAMFNDEDASQCVAETGGNILRKTCAQRRSDHSPDKQEKNNMIRFEE